MEECEKPHRIRIGKSIRFEMNFYLPNFHKNLIKAFLKNLRKFKTNRFFDAIPFRIRFLIFLMQICRVGTRFNRKMLKKSYLMVYFNFLKNFIFAFNLTTIIMKFKKKNPFFRPIYRVGTPNKRWGPCSPTQISLPSSMWRTIGVPTKTDLN